MFGIAAPIFTGFWKDTAQGVVFGAWGIAKVIIFFVLVRAIAFHIIDRVLKAISARESAGPVPVNQGRIRTLGTLVKSTVFYVLVFIAGVMVLGIFDVDPTPVLTAAGVVGLAVGFGAQKLVRDIISGFFIVLENQYSVGEYVTICTVTGTVAELGMRVTQLRDDMGKLVIIANGDITQVTNHSRGPIRATMEVSVAPDSDLAKVRETIDNVGKEIGSAVDGVVTPPTADGIIAADSTKVTIRVSGEVKPGSQEAVQAALRESIVQRFSSERIKLV